MFREKPALLTQCLLKAPQKFIFKFPAANFALTGIFTKKAFFLVYVWCCFISILQ